MHFHFLRNRTALSELSLFLFLLLFLAQACGSSEESGSEAVSFAYTGYCTRLNGEPVFFEQTGGRVFQLELNDLDTRFLNAELAENEGIRIAFNGEAIPDEGGDYPLLRVHNLHKKSGTLSKPAVKQGCYTAFYDHDFVLIELKGNEGKVFIHTEHGLSMDKGTLAVLDDRIQLSLEGGKSLVLLSLAEDILLNIGSGYLPEYAVFKHSADARFEAIRNALIHELGVIASEGTGRTVSPKQLSGFTALASLIQRDGQKERLLQFLQLGIGLESGLIQSLQYDSMNIAELSEVIETALGADHALSTDCVIIGGQASGSGKDSCYLLFSQLKGWEQVCDVQSIQDFQSGYIYQYCALRTGRKGAEGVRLVRRFSKQNLSTDFRLHNRWELIQFSSEPLDSIAFNTRPYLVIDLPRLTLNGFDGCRRITGEFSAGDSTFRVHSLGSNGFTCSVTGNFENRYLASLLDLRSYQISGSHLILHQNSGDSLIFRSVYE